MGSFLILLASLVALAYYYVKRKYNYWADLGVPFVKPQFPYGNLKGAFKSITMGEKTRDFYRELKGQSVLGGMYFFISPVAIICDLDFLRNILVKDFQYFQNRGLYHNEKADPLSANMFALEGDKWSNLRTKLSPTFTSGKMKMMHSTFLLVAEQFRKHLQPLAEQSTEVEMKELLASFTTDIIGNVAFGVECNSIEDPNSAFRVAGRKVFESTTWAMIRNIFLFSFPNLGRMLNAKSLSTETSEFFLNLVRKTVDYREKNDVKRDDFMSLLLQIKNTGKLDGETMELGKLTFEELAAQTFLFFIAGFETSSSTMTFVTYELALNPDIQERAREEVQEVLSRHGGVLSYEAAMEMTYLDQIIKETLRKYPIVAQLRRKLSAPYKVPNTNIVLEKDTQIQIPILGIHHDPDIYPDPEVFDPTRFTKENIAARHPYAWLPFGEGKRNCIGMRFGMMQTRIGLATILNSFKLSPSERTLIPMRFQPNGVVLGPDGGMFLRLESI